MRKNFPNCFWAFALLMLLSGSLQGQPTQVVVSGAITHSKPLDGQSVYIMTLGGGSKHSKFFRGKIRNNQFTVNLNQNFLDTLVHAQLFISSLPAMDYKTYVQNMKDYKLHDFIIDTTEIRVKMNHSTKHAMIKGGELNRQKRQYDLVDSTYNKMVKERRVEERYKTSDNFFENVNSYKLFAYLDIIQKYPSSLLSVRQINLFGKLTYPGSYQNRERIKEVMNSLSPELQKREELKKVYQAYEARLLREEPKKGTLFPAVAIKESRLDVLSANNSLNGEKKYVLLDFWATWCRPCIQQHPELQKINTRLKGSKVEIVGVSVDEDLDQWRKYLVKHPMDFPQVRIDPNEKELLDIMGIAAVPSYILVEKSTRKILEHRIPFADLEKVLARYQ